MLVEWGLIRFLYKRPLDTLLATWGLSLILQQAYRSIFGAREVGVELPSWLIGSVQVTDTIEIPINGLFVMAVTILITVSVALLIFRSRFGQQVRAVMSNRAMAGAVGIDTEKVDRYTFGLGCGIAGIAGSAFTMIGSTGPTSGQLYIVDTFLIVVFGGGREPARHYRVGLLDLPDAVDPGVLPLRLDGQGHHPARGGRHPDAEAAGPLHPQGPALRIFPMTNPVQTLTKSVTVNDNPFMKPVEWLSLLLLAGVILVVLPLVLDSFRLNLVGKYLTYAFVALGLVICWGYAGILSLGQGVFFGLGGYCMAMYLKLEASSIENTKIQSTPGIPDFMDWNQITALPWFWQPFKSLPLTLILAVAVPVLFAMLISFAMFKRRVGGTYFAIITQAIAAILTILIVGQQGYTGGINGITDLRTLHGWDIRTDSAKFILYFVNGGLLIACILAAQYVKKSKLGRILVAMRDKEDRVRFSGYSVAGFKVFAFCFAAGLAAIGGAMFTLQVGFMSPSFVGIVPRSRW